MKTYKFAIRLKGNITTQATPSVRLDEEPEIDSVEVYVGKKGKEILLKRVQTKSIKELLKELMPLVIVDNSEKTK